MLGLNSVAQAGTVEDDAQEVAVRAIKIFRQHCQPLGGKMWGDLENVTAHFEEEQADHRKGRGWKYHIKLAARVVDKPKYIPVYTRELGVIPGHVLYFFLGGGRQPGAFISKRVSKFLCGVENYDTGSDFFMPIPEFGALQPEDGKGR